MDKAPRRSRPPEDEPLFRKPTDDPTIRPDTISPAVEGYFRIPAVWIGTVPDSESVLVLNPQIHHAVVLEKEMQCGIRARVQRDGTFLFDFSSWSPAPQIEIPGYRISNPERSPRAPSASDVASRKSEEYAVLRAQVMNVHQSCLATSEQRLKRRSGLMGFSIRASSPLKGLTFDDAISYRNAVNDVHALARNVLNNKDKISRSRPYPRHALELEVVDHSLNLFDQILLAEDTALIHMIEATYLAACRVSEGRSGEAITLAWTVCEQLLSTAWETLLNDTKNDKEGAGRMPSRRKDKLEGRDYTASVKTEMLEINKRINHDLYLHLETARKARNDWAHNMREPETHEVHKAIRAVEGLLRQIKGIHLSLQLSGPPTGGPEWNIWIWEEIKSSGRA